MEAAEARVAHADLGYLEYCGTCAQLQLFVSGQLRPIDWLAGGGRLMLSLNWTRLHHHSNSNLTAPQALPAEGEKTSSAQHSQVDRSTRGGDPYLSPTQALRVAPPNDARQSCSPPRPLDPGKDFHGGSRRPTKSRTRIYLVTASKIPAGERSSLNQGEKTKSRNRMKPPPCSSGIRYPIHVPIIPSR